MTTPDLLSAYETCDRKGYWSQTWQRRRLDPTAMLRKAVTAGLIEADRRDYGEVAGETFMELAADPGMETPTSRNIHECAVHHAALADMLTTAIRKPTDAPWLIADNPEWSKDEWASSAFYAGREGHPLTGITFASSWNDERHYSTLRSWYALGEAAHFGLPMRMVVVILGQMRDGRRSGPWTRGFLHPQNHKLRFRKKSKVQSEVFSDRWEQVWREDRGEITNRDWLQAMLEDDILRDVLFTIDIPAPEGIQRRRINEMATAKMQRLEQLRKIPEPSMSVCDRPPCQFRGCCWSEKPYSPNERNGFVQIGR